jgi:RimJ/RimL family protein N-acetyltransferase/uncharacterized protein (DUF952 family)
MAMILHILTRKAWKIAQVSGEYRAASLAAEGFIHASTPEQVITTANHFYRGVSNLVLLWIDPELLQPELRWEPADGQVFPHIYGPLNLDAVRGVTPFQPDPDGLFRSLPEFPTQPTLETERLRLRPFTLADAPEVQRLAGERDIAATTLNIPHPYPDGAAEQWILSHQLQFVEGAIVNFAMTLKSDGRLVGAISLGLRPEYQRAELGYWAGKPYWGQGYTTEAARAVLAYGFEQLGLSRIYAVHFSTNPASGRVMQKIGMTYEGELREHILKWGVFHSLSQYGILRQDWVSQ